MTNNEEKEDDEDEGSSEGGVPCAALSDNHYEEGSRVLVDYKGKPYNATIHRHREKFGIREYLIHYDGNRKSTTKWIPVDHIKMERMTRECLKENKTINQIKMVSQFEPADEMEKEDNGLCDDEEDKDHEDETDYENNEHHDGQISSKDDNDNEDDDYKGHEDDEDDEDDKDDEDDEDDEDDRDEEDEEDDKDHEENDMRAFSNEVEGGVPCAPHSTLIKKLHILNQTPNYRRSDAEKDAIDHLMKKLHQMKSRQNHSLRNLSALNYLKRKVNTGSKDKTTAATRSNKKNCRVCRDHFKEPQEIYSSHRENSLAKQFN